MHQDSSLSIVKYFYIKSNSGEILYWIQLYSIALLPSWWVISWELKYAWRFILLFAFSRGKKSVWNHCKFKNNCKKTPYILLIQLQWRHSSRSAQIHMKTTPVAALVSGSSDEQPHVLSASSTNENGSKEISHMNPPYFKISY